VQAKIMYIKAAVTTDTTQWAELSNRQEGRLTVVCFRFK